MLFSNIDRQFVIWQALKPFDINNPSENPNRWYNPNDPYFKDVNETTELAPFRHLTRDGWKFWDQTIATALLGWDVSMMTFRGWIMRLMPSTTLVQLLLSTNTKTQDSFC
jgi:hypothetical protein